MGQAVAYNLWRRLEQLTIIKATKYMASTITIIEKDPTVIDLHHSISSEVNALVRPCITTTYLLVSANSILIAY